jgi:hypothetical protein
VSDKRPKKLANEVSVGAIDGFRRVFQTCQQASSIPERAPRPTWLDIEYEKVPTTNKWKLSITRTIAYSKDNLSRTYEVVAEDGNGVKTLDPGVSAYVKGGTLYYVQKGGLIGPNGRQSEEFQYNLGRSDHEFSGLVKLDTDTWTFSIQRDRSEYKVNGVAIGGNYTRPSPLAQTIGYTPDKQQAGIDMNKVAVATPPLTTAMSAGTGMSSPSTSLGDIRSIEVAVSDSPNLACPYVPCYFGNECEALTAPGLCDCLYSGQVNYCGAPY